MKFSLSYNNRNRTEADEIKCTYKGLGYYFEFIIKHPEKRYCISFAKDYVDSFFTDEVQKIIPIVSDYTIECDRIDSLKELLQKGYKAFLKYPVSDWEIFNQLKKLGVTDIYIDGPLGFSMEDIGKAKDSILIRVSPTVSSNASFIQRYPSSFYIRPEDLHLYDKTIDIIDFKVTPNCEEEEALFSIYKRGTFNYSLSNLVKTMQPNVENVLLPKDFGEQRVNCKQRCQLPGARCHYCDSVFGVTSKLAKVAGIKEI